MGAMWSVNYSFHRYKCADRVIPLGGKSDGHDLLLSIIGSLTADD
jgi:hypothetical protein